MSRPVTAPADRRAFLGNSLALASVVAASAVPAAAELSADAELLALREPFLTTLAAFEAAWTAHSPLEEAEIARRQGKLPPDTKADRRCAAAERLMHRRSDANSAVVDRMVAIPAHTLEGVALKALASHHEVNNRPDLVASLVADLMTMGGYADAS